MNRTTFTTVSVHVADDVNPTTAYTDPRPGSAHAPAGMAHIELSVAGRLVFTSSAALLALADELQRAAAVLRRNELAAHRAAAVAVPA
jgi:hypothetical protein